MLQPLAVNISSLAVAENMADLIDGYCRLEGKAESSLFIRPNKGTTYWVTGRTENWDEKKTKTHFQMKAKNLL